MQTVKQATAKRFQDLKKKKKRCNSSFKKQNLIFEAKYHLPTKSFG